MEQDTLNEQLAAVRRYPLYRRTADGQISVVPEVPADMDMQLREILDGYEYHYCTAQQAIQRIKALFGVAK